MRIRHLPRFNLALAMLSLVSAQAFAGQTKVLSVAIYDYVETSQWFEASVLSASMVVFAFLVILAMNLIDRRDVQSSA